jgi:hypothetical protein
MIEQQFYLTLPSNSSMSYYPNNTTTKFSTQLPQQITLNGKWEVALVEFHYPCTFQNIPEDDCSVLIRTDDKEKGRRGIYMSKLQPGIYERPESIVSLLNIDKAVSLFYKFKYNNETGFCELDGMTPLTDYVTSVTFPRCVSMQLGLQLDSKQPASTWPCNVRLGLPAALYVYCDIIEPQFTGDVIAPLLRIVSVDKSSYMITDQKTCIFSEPHYVRVLVNQFDSIEIDIRLDTGKPAPFQFGTSCVKLHFRRINYESS